jgi:hypothetical protein
MSDLKIYPHLVVENNKKPNRLLAFPLLGILIKMIILIPVFLEMTVLGFVAFFALLINWFVISFTGKYWDSAYQLFLGMMRLSAKVKLYIWGITDKYPGFTFDTNNLFKLDIAKPENPNRWLAIPLVGIAIRAILLIPYLIFTEVMERGSGVAMVISWFAVTFKSKFPESLYEFEKDTLRVSAAAGAYIFGLSDKYPSFSISMNHQTAKILLLVAGAILTAWRMQEAYSPDQIKNKSYKYQYQSDYSPQTDTDYKIY